MSTTPNRDTLSPAQSADMPQDALRRRALVRSAVDSVQRFKQSWISIMVLKGGIGLGQVTAVITLLILASVLPSPLYPKHKQSEPSDACPRPELFQTWMGVQAVRLTVCWAVSMWVCLRRRRRQRLEREAEEGVRGRSEVSRMSQRSRQSSSAVPTLANSSSSGSTSTLFQTTASESSHEPRLASSPDPRTSPGSVYIASYADEDSTPTLASNPHERDRKKCSLAPGVHRIDPPLPGSHLAGAVDNQASLQQARHMVQHRPPANMYEQSQTSELSLEEEPPARGFAATMDRLAPLMSKLLGLISIVLFILGNVLLFRPLPTQPMSCYHSAPMLWWGVMTVTGVGWFLLAQILLVVVFVGLGGPVMLVILRKMGISSPPQQPEPARPAPPAALTPSELALLGTVCYVPVAGSGSGVIDHGMALRLPHPAVQLDESRATCVICQEGFIAPVEGQEAMAEPLRALACGHVYHAKCIDQWLTRGAANCPFCNRSVRDMLRDEASKEHAEGNENGASLPQERRKVSWFRRFSS
ncbi:hypothetical protein IAU60_004708 [Kwoniella sp. DSM 27419]